ncbi:membrane protein insertion efficiency factor YidD [Candidatus Palauibacter sp.]
MIGAIRAYQLVVSPWLPPGCRYEPSCSEYALTSLRRFGAGQGSYLVVRRLLRCQPFGSYGHDPVPARKR